MGNRYGGLKQVDPVGPGGEIIVDYSIYDALRAGFVKVVFVIRKDIEQAFKQAVGRRFERHIAVEYVFQELAKLPLGFSVPTGRTKPWGTLHAILMAADVINETIDPREQPRVMKAIPVNSAAQKFGTFSASKPEASATPAIKRAIPVEKGKKKTHGQ